jgi:hypothetical protein
MICSIPTNWALPISFRVSVSIGLAFHFRWRAGDFLLLSPLEQGIVTLVARPKVGLDPSGVVSLKHFPDITDFKCSTTTLFHLKLLASYASYLIRFVPSLNGVFLESRVYYDPCSAVVWTCALHPILIH